MSPNLIHDKKILLSCLNWGFGHVARCLPLIHQLLYQGNSIYIAASKEQSKIFKSYFPDLYYIDHKDYPFNFKGKGNFGLDLLQSYFTLKSRITEEQKEVEKLVDEFKFDIILSDHRYGFYSKRVHSICIVHQINLPLKWYQSLGQKVHHRFLRKFDELWVPDEIDSRFAGKLSKNNGNFSATYIGALSRFSLYPATENSINQVVILSGPTIYAQQLFEQLNKRLPIDTVYIGSEAIKGTEGYHFYVSNDWKACDELILKAKKIISRSGYSTIMDLKILGAQYELTATPGQLEQEYLLELHQQA